MTRSMWKFLTQGSLMAAPSARSAATCHSFKQYPKHSTDLCWNSLVENTSAIAFFNALSAFLSFFLSEMQKKLTRCWTLLGSYNFSTNHSVCQSRGKKHLTSNIFQRPRPALLDIWPSQAPLGPE